MKIRAVDIKKSFGEPSIEVLHGINLEIGSGEMVSLTGRSGSGKSTLLYILSSLDRASSGEVYIDDQALSQMSTSEMHRFRNQRMGFVFQFHYLLPELTVLENVLMPALKENLRSLKNVEALTLLEQFGLAEKRDRLPRQLSGGEQQRVAIARALVMSPRIIFADEPTGNLDSHNGSIVMDIMRSICRDKGTTVAYVTHDPDFASLADRRIHLVDGRLQT